MKEHENKTKKKLIELPVAVFKRLEKMAQADNRKLKPYIEVVLMEHAWKDKNKTL